MTTSVATSVTVIDPVEMYVDYGVKGADGTCAWVSRRVSQYDVEAARTDAPEGASVFYFFTIFVTVETHGDRQAVVRSKPVNLSACTPVEAATEESA